MRMTKRLMLGSAIAAAMASAPVLAGNHGDHSATGGTFADGLTKDAYVAASVGLGDMGLDDAVIGSLVYGKDLGGYVTNLGIEVEVTGTLADAEGLSTEASYFSVGTYATYGYNLGQHIGVEGLDVFGKAGLAYNSYEYDYSGTGFDVSYDDSDVEFGYGVGVNYNLQALTGTDQFGVRAEWADNGFVDEIKVGLSYVF